MRPCEVEAGVFEAADIREWGGHDAVVADGRKIGELEAVYVDTGTDLPSFGTVKVGMLTQHRLASSAGSSTGMSSQPWPGGTAPNMRPTGGTCPDGGLACPFALRSAPR
jgi:hypothetical protein